MGSLTTSRIQKRGLRLGSAVLVAGSLLLGCGSGTGTAVPRSAPASVEGARTQALDPVEVTGIELRDTETGVRLEVSAGGPLIWTQYRDIAGRLVLELPNSQAAPGLESLAPAVGLVREVTMETLSEGERPLLRLIIETREEAEHELVAETGGLTLTLVPAGDAESLAFAYEPLPEEGRPPLAPEPSVPEPPEVAEAPIWEPVPPAPASPPSQVGTPQAPYVAPAPRGVPASRLQTVEVDTSDRQPMVWIHGDGEFAYSTFLLDDPPRFVIDLHGVVNLSPRGVVPGPRGILERVRVAQFKSQPDPVSRVVLDLRDTVVPQLLRTEEGLLVSFLPEAPTATAEAAPVPPEPPPAPTTRDEPREPLAPERAREEPLPPAEVEIRPAPAPASRAEAPPEPARPPPPAPPPVPAPQPSDVALFEAMDVQDPPMAWQAPQATTFDTREVTEATRAYVGEPISFTLRDADIVEVLRTFARFSELNMVVQPGVRGSVTVELEAVPWDQALEVILKTNDLWYEIDGNIMRIAPRAQLAREAREEAERRTQVAMAVPLRTVMKRVSYSDANEIAGLLRSGAASILSARGSVAVDRRTNTLIIKELPDFMDSVLAIIDQVDVPEPQVMIEARIVETSKRFSRTLGIQWGFQGVADAAHGNTTGLVFPSNIDSAGGVNLLTGGRNAFLELSMGNVLDSFRLDVALQAAESEGLVNILSAPKVATLNNQRATIQSGLQIPVQTVANNTVTVQFVNATLRLNVTPQVTAEGTVMMDIDIQKREPQLAFAVVGATNAPISTKEARTRVIVRDGGTTVIGGIYEVSSDFGQDRVPGLANIPVLGHLFRNRRRTADNEELLIFITPRVIKL